MTAIDPDCRDGKHRACIGAAWDEMGDHIVDCECPCHAPDREVCPQPCEHLSQHDAREGRTCPEHPCTCTDRENGSKES